MKYVLVTGGVISGIGKGVVASSVGVILKRCNVHVTSIKIDPYINIDAGTFSPYEHGEVYVLDDGGEVDLDLGNYERFLDVTLHRDNNITTGKIYQHVINKERKGDYLGKTVQVVPHITDAIQAWVERVAKIPVSPDMAQPEVCIIELGGTIGDIEGMPFVEAFRQFQFRVGRENFCSIHVSLVPQPKATGEHKTKPTQASVRELRGLGISPDLIVCRSEKPIDGTVKEKLSNFCHVLPNQVINIHDCPTIYHVPLVMRKQGLVDLLSSRLCLNLPTRKGFMSDWKNLADRAEHLRKDVAIALVGKYTQLEDAYASVIKALNHAALAVNCRLKLSYISSTDLEIATKEEDPVLYHEAWKKLCQCQGVLVPGGFGQRGVEGKIAAAHWARTTSKPFLGICLGLQCAVVEFARNVLGIKDAHTSEILGDASATNAVVIDMPEHNPGQMGGTMRLGKRTTIFKTQNSVLRQLYGSNDYIEERHRHRYEVNPAFIAKFEEAGMKFVGHDVDNVRMEAMELDCHPFYVAVQYHPEYISRPMKPSPPYLGLILAATGKLSGYLSRGCQIPLLGGHHEESSDEEDLSARMYKLKVKKSLKELAESPSSTSVASSLDSGEGGRPETSPSREAASEGPDGAKDKNT